MHFRLLFVLLVTLKVIEGFPDVATIAGNPCEQQALTGAVHEHWSVGINPQSDVLLMYRVQPF